MAVHGMADGVELCTWLKRSAHRADPGSSVRRGCLQSYMVAPSAGLNKTVVFAVTLVRVIGWTCFLVWPRGRHERVHAGKSLHLAPVVPFVFSLQYLTPVQFQNYFGELPYNALAYVIDSDLSTANVVLASDGGVSTCNLVRSAVAAVVCESSVLGLALPASWLQVFV